MSLSLLLAAARNPWHSSACSYPTSVCPRLRTACCVCLDLLPLLFPSKHLPLDLGATPTEDDLISKISETLIINEVTF